MKSTSQKSRRAYKFYFWGCQKRPPNALICGMLNGLLTRNRRTFFRNIRKDESHEGYPEPVKLIGLAEMAPEHRDWRDVTGGEPPAPTFINYQSQ